MPSERANLRAAVAVGLLTLAALALRLPLMGDALFGDEQPGGGCAPTSSPPSHQGRPRLKRTSLSPIEPGWFSSQFVYVHARMVPGTGPQGT